MALWVDGKMQIKYLAVDQNIQASTLFCLGGAVLLLNYQDILIERFKHPLCFAWAEQFYSSIIGIFRPFVNT